MARIMVALELGGGLGHMVPLVPIVRWLSQRGHDVTVAANDVAQASSYLDGFDVVCLQSPVRPVRSRDRVEELRSFAHVLESCGFADAHGLFARAEAWRNLLRLVEPDLVLIDHAPTALLASRAVATSRVNMGIGFCCPPDVSPFPDFRPWLPDVSETLRRDEQRLLENVNGVLEAWGVAPLERMSQLYADVDHTFLQTFAELDHYPDRESADYCGTWTSPGGASPQWPEAPGTKRIFGYLKQFKTLPQLITEIKQTDCPTLIYIDELREDFRQRHEGHNVRFVSERLDLAQVAAECDLAILNGGHGVTATMLLSGTPTMQIPLQLEQAYNGSAVAKLDAGFGALPEKPEDFGPVLKMLLTNDSFTAGAKQFAQRYADFDAQTQIDRICRRLEEIVAQEPVESS